MRTNQGSLKLTRFACFPQRQQGATLIVALVMLLLISLLAIGGMQGSILQERMSSNAHDGAISFQASEAALRQAETDLILGPLAIRLDAFDEARIPTPWTWDGANNPTFTGTGNVGGNVSAQPVYHHAYLADVPSNSIGTGDDVQIFERYEVTSRGQGGSPDAVSVLQSTVLLSPQ
jgi:type IV pilus assembly protein PilX